MKNGIVKVITKERQRGDQRTKCSGEEKVKKNKRKEQSYVEVTHIFVNKTSQAVASKSETEDTK